MENPGTGEMAQSAEYVLHKLEELTGSATPTQGASVVTAAHPPALGCWRQGPWRQLASSSTRIDKCQ